MLGDSRQGDSYNDLSAAALIGANAVVDAATVLVLGLLFVDGIPSPAVFMWLFVGAAVGCVGFVAVRYGPVLRCRSLREPSFVCECLLCGDFLRLVVSRCDWPLFVASAALIGPMSASVIIGVQPILFALMLERFTRGLGEGGAGRYNRVTSTQMVWMLGAFSGVVLVIMAQDTETGTLWHGWGRTVLGVALGTAATVSAALSAARFSLGARVWIALSSGRSEPLSARTHPEISAAILSTAASNAVAAAVLAAALFAGSALAVAPADAVGALAVGVVCMTAGMVTRTAGCLRTENVDLNAIHYATPLISIGLLAAAGLSGTVNVGLVVAGALCVVASNSGLAWVRRRSTREALPHSEPH